MARISPQAAVATVFVAAMFITIIDATVVNVALPTIAADLGAPVELTATVTIGFLVALRSRFRWLAGSAIDGRSRGFPCRGHSVHGGLCGLWVRGDGATIGDLPDRSGSRRRADDTGRYGDAVPDFPAVRARPAQPGIINIPIALAPAIGAVLGGFLVQRTSRRWIFWINLAAPSRVWRRPSARRPGRHRSQLPRPSRTSGRPRPTHETPPTNETPRAGGEGATAGARNRARARSRTPP